MIINLATHRNGEPIILKSIKLNEPYAEHYVVFVDDELKKTIRMEAKKRAKMILANVELAKALMK